MNKKKIIITAAAAGFVVISGILFMLGFQERTEAYPVLEEMTLEQQEGDILSEEPEAEKTSEPVREQEKQKETEAIEEVFAHVCGAVKNPGVYSLLKGARVSDFISCAGGLTEEAAGDFVNQAGEVADGERIYIPCKEEAAAWTSSTSFSEQKISAPDSKEEGTKASDKICLNTASVKELMTLPGIGQSKAERIIQYREENGPFKNTEELMKIEGIKEGVFQKIQDLVIINEQR